jgi:hypothetical protein
MFSNMTLISSGSVLMRFAALSVAKSCSRAFGVDVWSLENAWRVDLLDLTESMLV